MADCLDKIKIYVKEPLVINGVLTNEINVPCGKCPRCIERRKMEWGFRMKIEMDDSKTAYFVTLTYDSKHKPYRTDDEKYTYGKGTLNPNDLTKFFKRLRINQERGEITIEHLVNNLKNTDKIKYYAAGEYGEKHHRPHYHAIIFNTSESNIYKSWTLGQVHCVKANAATISYVMKYLDKHFDKKQPKYKHPEYNVMSEGIGLSYIEKNKNFHKRNLDILYVTNTLGVKIPMPKYYRLKLFNENERKLQVIMVENRLNEIMNEDIETLGFERFMIKEDQTRKTDKKIFIKKMKKRNID